MALTWGSTFIVMKNTLQYASPLAFLTLRFCVAAVILAIVFYKKLGLLIKKRIIIYSLILGMLNVSIVFFQITGLKFTSASNSAFITSFSVLLVPLFSAVILKKLPRKSSVAGVLIAFLGLYCITGGLDTALNIGDLLTFFCATAVALQMVFVAMFIIREDGLLLSVGQQIVGALLGIFLCLLISEPVFTAVTFNHELILSLLYVGGLCTAYNCTAQINVQKYVNTISVALILLLEPVFALAFAMFVKGPDGTTEMLTLLKVIGSLLIIGGAVFSELDVMDKILALIGRKQTNKQFIGEKTYEKTLK